MSFFVKRLTVQNASHSITVTRRVSYDFSKVFLLNKITRYEFEKKRYANLNDVELKRELNRRGSNFEGLVENHEIHYRAFEKVVKALKDHGIETRIGQRYTCKAEDLNWANCVITAGGDGTFLYAAGRINSNTKPIVGVNTDVTSSEGNLLLPKYYSVHFSETVSKLLRGEFEWLMRARIRTTLEGHGKLNLEPIELHDQILNNLEYRYVEHFEENRQIELAQKTLSEENDLNGNKITYLVPNRALNEVFIGESLSARVSYYQMSIDDGRFFKQKSSGIIACTGTGSTSWCYNINKISSNSMRKILKLAQKELANSISIPYDNDSFVHSVTNQFNDSIVFEPHKPLMSYTIRDPIINRIFTNETSRGFAKKLVIQSRCFDAVLVIDGGCSYQFNAGAKAILETLPEDSLRTILLNEE